MSLIEMLKEAGIVKIKSQNEEPFTLKSGKKSRLFIDIKEASLNPIILEEIVRVIKFNWDWYTGMNKMIIGSVAIGGIPIASVLSVEMMINQIIVRTEKHDRGTKSQVIGNCKDKKVLLIEDVATTGGSIINAVQAIHDAGGICHSCIVIVDRQEGAELNCVNNGISLYSLLKKSDFGINESI